MSRFTEEEKEKIKQAVVAAEGKTTGEIVPYFVEKSDSYLTAHLWSAVMFMASVLAFGSLLSILWKLSFPINPLQITLATLGFGLVGYFLPQVWPFWKRIMIGENLLNSAVRQRAIQAFVSEEVFNTKNRTGILLFISHFERRVEVMGDTGINQSVQQSDWNGIINDMVDGIKKGSLTDGIVAGILDAGELLSTAGVYRPENPNELPDGIRTE